MSVERSSATFDLCANKEFSIVADICNPAGERKTLHKNFSKLVCTSIYYVVDCVFF